MLHSAFYLTFCICCYLTFCRMPLGSSWVAGGGGSFLCCFRYSLLSVLSVFKYSLLFWFLVGCQFLGILCCFCCFLSLLVFKQHIHICIVCLFVCLTTICIQDKTEPPSFGWHYLSNPTCLMRTRLFYVLFVVSRIIMVCQSLRHFLRKAALDK